MAKRQNHNVQPIKDSNVLRQVQDTLLNNFKAGRRNYTIFQLGKATLLRVSDVLSLEYADLFTPEGVLKDRAYITDQKTGKPNTLYLKPLESDLMLYHDWLVEQEIDSPWLFSSTTWVLITRFGSLYPPRHLTELQKDFQTQCKNYKIRKCLLKNQLMVFIND